ncbi:MAG: hypothetical protein J6S96_09250 [Muribaculaceae bacterium]|nr:hypothetical protein [Muribaculaceae bacterium]
MDINLENRLNEALERARSLTGYDSIEYSQLDPVQRMMLVALIYECQKINDYADGASERIAQRFAEDFIPRRCIEAMPAIALLGLRVKQRAGNDMVMLGHETTFRTKPDPKLHPNLQALNFIPVFRTMLLAHSDVFTINKRCMHHHGEVINIQMERANRLYLGIRTSAEVDCLQGLSLLIHGTRGVAPVSITVGTAKQQLSFATMDRMEDIEMLEPFDSQQASGRFFSFIESWKEQLLEMNNASLIYITDATRDRDLFKPRAYPSAFQQWLESEQLNRLSADTLWLRLDFPEGFDVPDACQVELNVVPVANVDLGNVTLTPSAPIAKLQKQEGAFFLDVLEQSNAGHQMGFPSNSDEFVIRDFDAACYNNGDLFRDVRMLYNRFVDDYYAFIEYNGIKDGEIIRTLRSTITSLGKAVKGDNARYRFDSGTYAMKNIAIEDTNSSSSSSVRVSFITTQGQAGNAVRRGMTLENRRNANAALEREAEVIVGGMGGRDKATPDQRYELLRYNTLTADRLFTRMDIDAFLRKEIMTFFGREEFKRIFIKMSLQGAEGEQGLQRGLYIDIEFKDRKNYDQAMAISLASLLQQRIARKSCLTIPVVVNLVNLEGNMT